MTRRSAAGDAAAGGWPPCGPCRPPRGRAGGRVPRVQRHHAREQQQHQDRPCTDPRPGQRMICVRGMTWMETFQPPRATTHAAQSMSRPPQPAAPASAPYQPHVRRACLRCDAARAPALRQLRRGVIFTPASLEFRAPRHADAPVSLIMTLLTRAQQGGETGPARAHHAPPLGQSFERRLFIDQWATNVPLDANVSGMPRDYWACDCLICRRSGLGVAGHAAQQPQRRPMCGPRAARWKSRISCR